MIDLATTVEAKVDQLTADELLAGPRKILITKVTGNDSPEQPVSIHFEGDNGKPFKPCKTMRRVLMHMWGRDASQFVGRSLVLYRDETVKFGGLQVGGVRISQASHIEREMNIPVTMKQGQKAPVKVKPIKADVAPLKVVTPEPDAFDVLTFAGEVANYISTTCDADELSAWWAEKMPLRKQAAGVDAQAARQIAASVTAKINELKGEI